MRGDQFYAPTSFTPKETTYVPAECEEVYKDSPRYDGKEYLHVCNF